eukprot:796386-Prorocentrum_minimum.AAC.2
MNSPGVGMNPPGAEMNSPGPELNPPGAAAISPAAPAPAAAGGMVYSSMMAWPLAPPKPNEFIPMTTRRCAGNPTALVAT